MKKASAQNPNLLRTLIGLSLTLIVLLSYAVYGATISPSYYIYETDTTDTVFDDVELTKVVQNNETTWIGSVAADGQNLTWINVTVDDWLLARLSNSLMMVSSTTPVLGRTRC